MIQIYTFDHAMKNLLLTRIGVARVTSLGEGKTGWEWGLGKNDWAQGEGKIG